MIIIFDPNIRSNPILKLLSDLNTLIMQDEEIKRRKDLQNNEYQELNLGKARMTIKGIQYEVISLKIRRINDKDNSSYITTKYNKHYTQ